MFSARSDADDLQPFKCYKAPPSAEKLRALIQQPVRIRYRRQDVYDIFMLLKEYGQPSEESANNILDSLKQKAKSRGITVTEAMLRDSAIKEGAQKDYKHLDSEIEGRLPQFEQAYERVQSFYEGLLW